MAFVNNNIQPRQFVQQVVVSPSDIVARYHIGSGEALIDKTN